MTNVIPFPKKRRRRRPSAGKTVPLATLLASCDSQTLLLLPATVYADPDKRTRQQCWYALRNDIAFLNECRSIYGHGRLRPPTRAALDAMIAALDPYMVYTMRHGSAAAIAKFVPDAGGMP